MNWKESKKDNNGWAYESSVATDCMHMMSNLCVELRERGIKDGTYERFFKETTDKIMNLLNE